MPRRAIEMEICNPACGIAAGLALAGCAIGTAIQLRYWKNTVALFERALAVTSENWIAHGNLGVALKESGRMSEAIEHYREALRIDPAYINARMNLGDALLSHGRFDEAIGHYREVLRIKPDSTKASNNLASALNNLAWLRATASDPRFRNGVQAVELAERFCRLFDYRHPMALGTLAAAYAEAGQFGEAVKMARKAMDLAKADGEEGFVRATQARLQLYERGLPYHENTRPEHP